MLLKRALGYQTPTLTLLPPPVVTLRQQSGFSRS